MSRWIGLCLFLISIYTFGKRISYTAGSVKKEAVTSREVNIQFIIEQILYEGGRKVVALPLKEKALKKEVSTLLLEKIIYLEAISFQVAEVPKNELRQMRSLFLKNLKKSSYLKHWNSMDVGKNELNVLLVQKLRTKKFIDFKRKSSEVAISNQEAKEYYDRNQRKFGSLSFDSLKENIKNYLKQEQSSKRLSAWFQNLRVKYEVRNFLRE